MGLRYRLLCMLVVVGGLSWGGSPVWGAEVAFEKSSLELETASGRHVFTVELAVTDRQLSQGLMNRTALPAGAGMLFDFGADQAVSMWMRNTLISLDMLFIDRNGAIVGIEERTTPMSTSIIQSPGPVRAVLELNAGTAEHLGVHPGDRVLHPIFGD